MLIHKIIINKESKYIFDSIVRGCDKHKYYTRSGLSIDVLHTRTRAAENCLTYGGFNYYNQLPDSLKQENRLVIFKRCLKCFIKEKF